MGAIILLSYHHHHPAIISLKWWTLFFLLIPTHLVISSDHDLGLFDNNSKSKQGLTNDVLVQQDAPPGPNHDSGGNKGGRGGGGSVPTGIFTLLPIAANPFSTLYQSKHHTALSNATVIGDKGKATANAVSKRGGHVLSTATVIGKDGSASAKAISVGGENKQENSATSIAQGKKVFAGVKSDAVSDKDAVAKMEESAHGGDKFREDVDKYFDPQRDGGNNDNEGSKNKAPKTPKSKKNHQKEAAEEVGPRNKPLSNKPEPQPSSKHRKKVANSGNE